MGRHLLYQDAVAGLGRVSSIDHGLRFGKYFGGWPANDGPSQSRPFKQDKSALLDWMQKPPAAGWPKGAAVKLETGDAGRLEEAARRLEALADQTLDVGLVSRLLTGIGLPHPSENGFLFHPTLAVPYLRGSGLKQVARQAAEAAGASKRDLARIFGALTPEGEAPGGVGSVCFLDGLPTKPVTLTAEQITPHYTGYYQGPNPALGGARQPMQSPADWYEPIPITLLAVEGSWDRPQPFRTGLRGSQDDVKIALGWLGSGLAEFGFGARTTLGFGRLLTKAVIDANATGPQGVRVGTRILYTNEEFEVTGWTPEGVLKLKSMAKGDTIERSWDPRTMTLQ